MRQLLDRIPSNLRPTTPVLVAAASVGIATLVVVAGVGSLGRALLAPSVDAEEADPLEALAKESEEFFATSKKRFDGRSVYALPAPPVRRPKVTEAPRPAEPPKDPVPPPPPTTYSGPAPTSIIGDVVVFESLSEGDKRIKVGETKSGITVLETNSPFSCKLGYMRGEYVVSLFPRVDSRFLRGGMPSSPPPGVIPVTGAAAGGAGGRAGIPAGAGVPEGAGVPGGPGSGSPAVPGAISGPGAVPPPVPGAAPAGSPVTPISGPGPANGNAVTGGGAPVPAGTAGSPVAPGPGADPPSSGELPSPAMEPQRLPTQIPPAGGQPPQDAGQDFVDRSLLPPRRTPEEINGMSVDAARSALAAIDATSGWNVDGHSRAQLNYERELLVARINRVP